MFKIGDAVTSIAYGKGVVKDVKEGSIYPIIVHFDEQKTTQTFTEEGRYSEQIIHAINILGFSPNKITCNYTDELRQIRRKARLGYNTPDSIREKIRKSLNKKVKCLTDDIEFESIKQAVIYSGISKTTFHRKLHKEELINGKKYEIY